MGINKRLAHLRRSKTFGGFMTLKEADKIIEIVSSAFHRETRTQFHKLSELQGYDIFDIDIALKLRTAQDYLESQRSNNGEEAFKKAVNTYEVSLMAVLSLFADDEKVDQLEQLPENSPEYIQTRCTMMTERTKTSHPDYERWAKLETVSSFANFCRYIGAADPLYWQKIYTHLELEYISDSPRGEPNYNGNLHVKNPIRNEYDSQTYNKNLSNTETSRLAQVLRWFAVLPGAIMCAFLATFPIHWGVMLIQLFGNSSDDSFVSIDGKTPLAAIPSEMLERFGYALFTPIILIIIGAKIAPKYKAQTGIAITVLWALGFGAALTMTIFQRPYIGWSWPRIAITFALGVAGAAIGLYRVHKTEYEN